MLEGIRFNDKRFHQDDDCNIMAELTGNTIILCRNFDMMQALAEEIYNTINGRAEHNDYYCDEEDVGKARYKKTFFLQHVIKINDQKITLCLEPAMVYRAQSFEDIWFFDHKKVGNDYLWTLTPLSTYKGAKEIWDKGLDCVYTQVTIGRYGGYTGEWIDDDRTHIIWV